MNTFNTVKVDVNARDYVCLRPPELKAAVYRKAINRLLSLMNDAQVCYMLSISNILCDFSHPYLNRETATYIYTVQIEVRTY